MLNRGIDMNKTLRKNMLFDFYGCLLTERQQEIYQMYFTQDMSLGEIAEQLDISRQAVYDIIKRSSLIMEDFEAKLKLLEKYMRQQKMYDYVLDQLSELAALFKANNHIEEITKISQIKTTLEKIKSDS